MWNADGNIVSNANNTQTNPKNISDGKGGSLYVWQDFRNGINDDIYVQHFSANGVEGIFDETFINLNNVNIYPNPIAESAIIQFSNENINKNSCIGIIYDIFGKKISTFNIEKSNSKIDVKTMTNGIYFLKIIEKKNQFLIKSLLLKNKYKIII